MSVGLVLGFFDGVHKAHKDVIQSAFECSDEVYVLTFQDSPAVYFGNKCEYLIPRNHSVNIIRDLGVKEVVQQDFPEIAYLSADEYLNNLVNTYHPVSISTGFNHTFGLNKFGTPKFLKENQDKYNYKYICVPSVCDDGEVISSSLIKKYVRVGNIERANTLLGYNFFVEGVVVHGAKLGRTIGFPTANIEYPNNIVQLPFGVYSAFVGGKKAVVNWGIKPTVNNNLEPIVEVHILDFNDDLYGKNIRIDFVKKIRSEIKFNNIDELKQQIKKDIEEC